MDIFHCIFNMYPSVSYDAWMWIFGMLTILSVFFMWIFGIFVSRRWGLLWLFPYVFCMIGMWSACLGV